MENKLSTLSPDIRLIVECCKKEQNKIEIKNCVSKINDWKIFINLSFAHGVFPLVYHTLKQYQELIPSDIIESMKSNNMDIVKQNMLMASELLKVMNLLEENGIEAISFKGPVLSQMAYGDIVSRQYVDLDILVHEKDLEKAGIVLFKNDYEEQYNLEEYQKENLKSVVHDRAFINQTNGINIELHWTLSSSEFFMDLEKLDCFKNTRNFFLKNKNLKTLSNEIHFIYLCIHGNKHMWERIEWLVDLVLFIKKQKLDFEKILNLSKQIDAERIVLSSFILFQHLFHIKIPEVLEKDINYKLVSNTNKYILNLAVNYSNLDQKLHTKKISFIQWYMLKTIKNRSKYIKALLTPTEKDYETMFLPKALSYFYFFMRPINIIFKSFKK